MLPCLDNRAFFSCHFLLASSSNRNLFMFMYSVQGTVEVLQLVINLWSVISGAVCDLLKVNYVLRHAGLRDLRFTHKTSSLFVHNQNITCPLS